MKDLLTVLIPTSPIPSHPSTAILDETISNIRKYTDAKIVIMFDGVHESLKHREDDYVLYISRVTRNVSDGKYGYCTYRIADGHEHQAIMTDEALLQHVVTPLILFCEHDASPIGDIPFDKLCWALMGDDRTVNYIRFNIFEEIPKEHQYLMLDRDQYGIGEDEFFLTHTIQWSQRPHLAKADWYRGIIADFFEPTYKGMIEDVMHGVVQTAYNESGRDLFGLTIFTPEGNQLRSYHSDGRGSDEKIIKA